MKKIINVCLLILLSNLGFIYGEDINKDAFMDSIYQIKKATFSYSVNKQFYEEISAKIKNIKIDDNFLSDLSDKEIDKGISALHSLCYTDNFKLDLLEKLYYESKKRGRDKLYKDTLRRTYLELREFDKFKKFLKENGDIENDILNMHIDDVKNRKLEYLAYDINDLKEAKLVNLALDKGKHIILILAFSCGRAERFMDTIVNDKEAFKIFRKNGKVVTLDFSPSSLLFLKLHYGFKNAYIAYNYKSFKNFNLDLSPGLYFIDNGKIVYYNVGFNKDSGDMFIKKAKEHGMIVKREEVFKNDYPSWVKYSDRLEGIGDYLVKIPEEERINFLETMKVKRGVVSSFDYDVLMKYYKGEEFIEIFNLFKPFQIILDKYENVEGKTLKDILSSLSQDERGKFLQSLQISKGLIRGATYFTPVMEMDNEHQRESKCSIFGNCD